MRKFFITGLQAYKHLIPAGIWSVVILVAISMPAGNIPPSKLLDIKYFDKLVHFALFGVLAILICWGLFKQHHAVSRFAIAGAALLAGTLYGALTEVFQHMVLAGRHGSISDFLFNFFGTVFGVLCMWMLYRHILKKTE